MVVPSRRRTLPGLALMLAAVPLAMMPPTTAMAQSAKTRAAAPAMPSFLDKSRVSDLVAARAAIDGPAISERDADQQLMSASDDLRRRAEEERALAAEVRAKAEALSQRFAEELSQDHKVAVAAAKSTPPVRNVRVGSAVQDERTASAMKRAAEALARARSTLDEADRRAAGTQGGGVGAWETVHAEIADARRKAAEAVDSAEKALSAVPADVAVAESSDAAKAADAGAKAPAGERKRMPPPFALGGTLR